MTLRHSHINPVPSTFHVPTNPRFQGAGDAERRSLLQAVTWSFDALKKWFWKKQRKLIQSESYLLLDWVCSDFWVFSVWGTTSKVRWASLPWGNWCWSEVIRCFQQKTAGGAVRRVRARKIIRSLPILPEHLGAKRKNLGVVRSIPMSWNFEEVVHFEW